jgi:hypothetical protein
MHFPVSGVECSPLVPFLVALAVSIVSTPAGISGAFLLLPFQMTVLGFATPAVSATNLIYNVVATPGGIYRYYRERRLAWPLACVVILGGLPGVVMGALIRVYWLPDARRFKAFAGIVLLYLGGRLLYETTRRARDASAQLRELTRKSQARPGEQAQDGRVVAAGLPGGAGVRSVEVSRHRVTFEFRGENYSFTPLFVVLLSLVVGVIGGIYGISGAAIMAPFLVSFVGLPIYTVAGATLTGTFVTSGAAVLVFDLLSHTSSGAHGSLEPDWALGVLFGLGGLAGTYLGARLQKYLPERWICLALGLMASCTGIWYVLQFFG